MNAPWINHKEIRQLDIKRQTLFYFTGNQEQTTILSDDLESEKVPVIDTDYVELETPQSDTKTEKIPSPQKKSNLDHIAELHKETERGKENRFHLASHELNDRQINRTDEILAYPINVLTNGYFISKLNNIEIQTRPFQMNAPLEIADSILTYSGSLVKSDNRCEPAFFKIPGLNKRRYKLIRLGISQALNTRKTIKTVGKIQSNEPIQLAIVDNPPVIDSKRVGITRLVEILKRVQTSKTADSFKPSADITLQVSHESESSYMDYTREGLNNDEAANHKSIDKSDEFPYLGTVYCKTIYSPFSTFIELNDFRHAPLFGSVSKNTFEFLDSNGTGIPKLDTTFISTSTYYPQQPSVHLVSSVIQELIYLTNTPITNETTKQKKYTSKSIAIPMHSSTTKDKSNYIYDSIKIRVPVVVGEYNIEIGIEEEIPFEEEVIDIKKISKNVELKKWHFIPTQFSETGGDGMRAATSGMLSIDGIIEQNIEYSAMLDNQKSSKKRTELVSLQENITLVLVVQLLQEQGIHVNYNDIKNY